jgi:rhodanese-related sulfurtransferase
MGFLSNLFGPPLPSVTALELGEKLKNGKHPLVLDVRQPAEYRVAHIPGAKLIPLGELDKRMQELPKNREIVCVCASGHRSSSATRMLINAGYNAIDMKGGMGTWRNAKLAIKKGEFA